MKRFGVFMMAAVLAVQPSLAQGDSIIIGVFDSAVVFDRSHQGQVLKADIERLRDRKLKEITDKQQELNALQQEVRAKELTFNDDTRTEMLQRINQKQIELQRLNDDAQRELQAAFNRAQQRLQKELINVVGALGSEGGYTMILEKGLTLFVSSQVDITEQVLLKFDEMYPPTVSESAPSGR